MLLTHNLFDMFDVINTFRLNLKYIRLLTQPFQDSEKEKVKDN